jgi:hypothetical protein
MSNLSAENPQELIELRDKDFLLRVLQVFPPEAFLKEKCKTEDQVNYWLLLRAKYAKIAEVMRNYLVDDQPFPEIPPLKSPDHFHIYKARLYLHLYTMLKQESTWKAIAKTKKPDWLRTGETPTQMLLTVIYFDAEKDFGECQKYTEMSASAMAKLGKLALKFMSGETLLPIEKQEILRHLKNDRGNPAHSFCMKAITLAASRDSYLEKMLKVYFETIGERTEAYTKKYKHLSSGGIGFQKGNRTKASRGGCYVRDTDFSLNVLAEVARLRKINTGIDL